MADHGGSILGSASQIFGVYTPDTCFELLSIESTRWKVIHNTGVTVGGHGIRVTDIPIGVTPAMNELKAVINYSAFFWFWDNMLYYGYMPNHNIPVCTPLSNRSISDLEGDQIRFAALYKDADVYWHSVNSWIYGTPYSPGESATYYIDDSGNSSPRTGSLLETRGVTPQGKIDPSAKAVNINVAFNGYPSLQNPAVSVGELLQFEKKNNMIHYIILLLTIKVSLEEPAGTIRVIEEVVIIHS